MSTSDYNAISSSSSRFVLNRCNRRDKLDVYDLLVEDFDGHTLSCLLMRAFMDCSEGTATKLFFELVERRNGFVLVIY